MDEKNIIEGQGAVETPIQTQAPAAKSKKWLIFGGVGLLVVAAGVLTAILLGAFKGNEQGAKTGEETAELSGEGEVLSLADYGLSDDATPEEVEAKMIELGEFDPDETYEDGEDVTEETGYCGDDSCEERTAGASTAVTVEDGVLGDYTEKAVDFIKETVDYYFTTAYPSDGAATIAKGEGDGAFVATGRNSHAVTVKVEGSEGGVTRVRVYNGEGKEVYSAKYYEI